MANIRAKTRLLIAAILMSGFIASSLYFDSEDINHSSSTPLKNESIDFFVTDATLTRWSETGAIQSVTQTPLAEHKKEQNLLKLQTPFSKSLRTDGSTELTLKAKKGFLMDDNSRFDVAGDVQLHHNPDSESDNLLLTEQLAYFPPTGVATSDVDVEFLNNQGRTEGVGMTLDTSKNTLDILSRVRGQYVSTTSN